MDPALLPKKGGIEMQDASLFLLGLFVGAVAGTLASVIHRKSGSPDRPDLAPDTEEQYEEWFV